MQPPSSLQVGGTTVLVPGWCLGAAMIAAFVANWGCEVDARNLSLPGFPDEATDGGAWSSDVTETSDAAKSIIGSGGSTGTGDSSSNGTGGSVGPGGTGPEASVGKEEAGASGSAESAGAGGMPNNNLPFCPASAPTSATTCPARPADAGAGNYGARMRHRPTEESPRPPAPACPRRCLTMPGDRGGAPVELRYLSCPVTRSRFSTVTSAIAAASEALSRRAGCGKSGSADAWGPREGNGPGLFDVPLSIAYGHAVLIDRVFGRQVTGTAIRWSARCGDLHQIPLEHHYGIGASAVATPCGV